MYDAIVVGAGAAGIAAARILHDADCNILVLEAQNRIGGRIYTVDAAIDAGDPTTSCHRTVEFGAELVCGEHCATHTLLHKYGGFETTSAPRYTNMWWAWKDGVASSRCSLSDKAQQTLDALDDAFDELSSDPELTLADSVVDSNVSDCSLATYLRQKGFSEEVISYADIHLAQTYCASIESLSVVDIAREHRVSEVYGYEESRVKGGYGPFLNQYSTDLSIQLNEPVEHIHHCCAPTTDDDSYYTVQTKKATYTAKTILITVSISVLQRGIINFFPPLSIRKQQAIQSFQMEAGTKLIYQFTKRCWSEQMHYLLQCGRTTRWWTDDNVVYCFVTAKYAEYIDSLSESEALAVGLSELSIMLKEPNLADFCIFSKRQSWAKEMYVGGGYAHVHVGCAQARLTLSESEQGLFFAGEATAYNSTPQTVHGAVESGWRAAKEIVEALRSKKNQ